MTKQKYFSSCKTKNEAKKLFRELAQKYHPDKNKESDTTEIMAAIINEYESIIKKLPSEKTTYNTHETDEQFNSRVSQEMQEVINNISHLPIDIEIIGQWLWVSGNTMPYKAYLTANNFLWSKEKKMYYWRLERQKSFRFKGTKGKDIDDIRFKYGSANVPNSHLAALA